MERVYDPFLNQMGRYGPNLVGALVTLVIGVLVAYLIAAITRRLFARTQLDEKIARLVRGDEATAGGQPLDSARWLSRGIFWLIIAVTLLAFFQALGFTPVTVPIQNALAMLIGFLPRLLAAGALLLLAWLVASFLRVVVRRGLQALKVDERLSRRAVGGLRAGEVEEPTRSAYETQPYGTPVASASREATLPPPAVRKPRIANALGQAAYWLTLLLFLPAILGALELGGILGPVQGMVDKILFMLPNVVTAVLVIGIAWFVARIVAGLATSLLQAVGVDRLAQRLGIVRPGISAAWMPSRIIGLVLMAVIVLVAAMEALSIVNFERLAAMLGDVVALVAQVAIGLVIFAVGLGLATLAARAIRSSNVQGAGLLANAARVAILVLAGAMGLQQMGLAQEIVNLAFGLLLGGIVIALAIAFGVGGRGVAARELDNWVRAAKERTERERVLSPDEPLPSPH
jgi:hypothetical protein